jgi:hypothetical protein
MESYLKQPPPSNASAEDLQEWANQEFAKLEQVIQSLISTIEELQNGP